jgi:aryl sulfotransferase
MRRYRSEDEDSARWQGFRLREGDIVVSTRSKHGTTWMQTILLLLIHQHPELPAPLVEISPWLDHLAVPLEDVVEKLEAQDHRRVIKTHTPLDGIPIDPAATYVVVGRRPLDAAISFYHQVAHNIDRVRQAEVLGTAVEVPDPPPLKEWLGRWVEADADPLDPKESLPKVMWHLGDAWKRTQDPNVILVHFDDLKRDLDGEMRALANHLGIAVPSHRWDELVKAATLDEMRARADRLTPDPAGLFKDKRAFFRSGESGSGAALLDETGYSRYLERAAELADPEMLAWLHQSG